MNMRVIIAGSRDFNDWDFLKCSCDEIVKDHNVYSIEIVSGTARGADLLGERYADYYGYPVKRFPANWKKYGKRAGYLRNSEMAEYADCLIAFWDGESKGTKHMIDLANKSNILTFVINYSLNDKNI